MLCFRFLLLLTFLQVSLSAAEVVIQDTSAHDQELNERDFAALRDYLNTKREDLESKKTSLAISGDVRFEWRHMNEKISDVDCGLINVRGRHRKDPDPKDNTPVSRNDFDCEFNLKFDYVMDRSWAVAHIQYDESAGVDSQKLKCDVDPHGWFGSGRSDRLNLRKAYMGYNFWLEPHSRLDIEVGRRGNLYHVFDSRVQFLSRFDGILLKWSSKPECFKEIYVKMGGLVVDERVDHFAYVVEAGFMNIYNSGFDFKYSFIDWCNQVGSRCVERDDPACDFKLKKLYNPWAYDFAVSQWSLCYHFDEDVFCVPAKIFGAFLMNHKRKYYKQYQEEDGVPVIVNGHRIVERKWRENLAWYVGLAVGEVVKEGDWALEIQYQVVQALAVPGQDAGGIGTGNVFDFTLYSPRHIDNTNYRGWKVEGLYALTDNITMDTIIEQSWTDNPHIGGSHPYSKLEVEAIYAF